MDYDIKHWNSPPVKYLEYFSKKKTFKIKSIQGLNFNCLRIYALFKSQGIIKPNGVYTLMKEGLALDNPIWWDYAIESAKGFIHLVRTCKQLEVNYYHEDENFNIYKFFQENLKDYHVKIDLQIESFEKHIVYINHYKSYLDAVEVSKQEISKIDITEPNTIKGHITTQKLLTEQTKAVEKYTNNLILFHSKAKSLLLNTAFMVESFINIIIRIGTKKELLAYPDVLKKCLNSNFKDKLQNIKFYTHIFKQDLNLEEKVIKDTLELMSIRNKYVHSDEYSKINILGEEYFDNEFPLFNVTEQTFQIDVLKKTYLNPSNEVIQKHYSNALEFKKYVFSLINDNYIEDIKKLININPLSYNTKRNVYSAIFPDTLMEFYLPLKEQ